MRRLLIPLLLIACSPTPKKAEEQGDAKALMKTALRYDAAGRYEDAVEWYRKAAEQGLSEAQNNLGVMYKDGQGVAQDEGEAVRWFLLAARQGNVLAQSNLGWMYQSGRGVAQNFDSARYWYHEAALKGHAAAQNNLGRMLRDGLGTEADTDSARYWIEKAALQGLPQARKNLERLGVSPSPPGCGRQQQSPPARRPAGG